MKELKIIEGWETHFTSVRTETNDTVLVYQEGIVGELIEAQAQASYQQGREEAIVEVLEFMDETLFSLDMGYGKKSDVYKSAYLTKSCIKDKLSQQPDDKL